MRHVANGGMASVWEAHDELLDRAVAVKLLAPHLSEDERARKRFQREARAAGVLGRVPESMKVTLHESHVAWASYEGPINFGA